MYEKLIESKIAVIIDIYKIILKFSSKLQGHSITTSECIVSMQISNSLIDSNS